MYRVLKSLNTELLQTASEVRQFFYEDAERKLEILSRFISEEKETQRAFLSRKSDDPEWFQGNDDHIVVAASLSVFRTL